MSSFDGVCALVTGSASGLGAATAVALARGGARVIVNYRASAREAEETADLCRAAKAEVKVVQADVAIDEDCRRLAAAAAEWGRLDILVNNASATKHVANPADLDALSAEDFHRLYGVNTIGPFQMIRAAPLARGRRPHRGARVVGGECFFGRLCSEQGGAQCANPGAGPLARTAHSGERSLSGLHGYAMVDERRGPGGGGQAARGGQGRRAAARGLEARGHCRGRGVPRRPRLASHDGIARAGRRRVQLLVSITPSGARR